ncbi:MAG: CBASS cGAMP-activated phospholipase [Verrucomicrobiota bacterium]
MSNPKSIEPINVLTLDGGGMRGLYTASVLETLASRYAGSKNLDSLDIGKGFDLIFGTSTGAILACGLAAGIDISTIKSLYRDKGPKIFPDPMPAYDRSMRLKDRLKFWKWSIRHRSTPGTDGKALKEALLEIFDNTTMGKLFIERQIGLGITTTCLHQHQPRIFKTGHLGNNFKRDDRRRLVDVCLASAAAPVYLPLAECYGDTEGEKGRYADGGLWANNPIVLGLTEALAIAEQGQPIRVLSLGTCPPPSGDESTELQRGLLDWKAGAAALELSMNAQARAAVFQADHLAKQLRRHGADVQVVRCDESPPSKDMAKLIGLDQATLPATEALIRHGAEDGTQAFRQVQNGTESGILFREILERMPSIL